MRKLFVLAVAVLLLGCGQPSARMQDQVERFGPDDATMNTAIEEARAGLPRFWELYDANQGENFMLKVGFPTPDGGQEHIWVDEIRREAGGLSARIQNEPENVPSVQYGQRAPFDEALVSDWAVTRDGRTYGHYTTRVVIASLPTEEQAQYASYLATFADDLP